jgi:hypothetical protein
MRSIGNDAGETSGEDSTWGAGSAVSTVVIFGKWTQGYALD